MISLYKSCLLIQVKKVKKTQKNHNLKKTQCCQHRIPLAVEDLEVRYEAALRTQLIRILTSVYPFHSCSRWIFYRRLKILEDPRRGSLIRFWLVFFKHIICSAATAKFVFNVCLSHDTKFWQE